MDKKQRTFFAKNKSILCKSTIIGFFVVQALSLLLIFGIMTWQSTQPAYLLYKSPSTDTIIMFIFIVLTLFFFNFLGLKPLLCMQRAENDFVECEESIKKKIGSGQHLAAWDLSKEISSANSPIKSALIEFGAEASRNTHGTNELQVTLCDIQDFVNHDLINEQIANCHISEIIPGMMTGLGILGTFVGLTIGLQGFNAESTLAMTASIEPLIEGIRTAFYTSIAGVLLSVGYNWVYKAQLTKTYNATDKFITTVYRVIPEPENEARFKSLEEQVKMTSQLAGFAQDVGVTVSSSMTKIVLPAMNDINQSITNFVHTSSDAQIEGIQRITEKFINEMNQSLNGSFEELGETIHNLCEWQEKSHLQLQSIVDGICNAATDVERINSSCKDVITYFENYTKTLSDAQQALSVSLIQVQQECEKVAAIMESQKEYFSELHEYKQSCSETMVSLEKVADGIFKQSEVAKRQLDHAGDAMLALVESSNKQTEEINRALALQSSTVLATMQNMKDETADIMAKARLEAENLSNTIASTMQGSVNVQIEEMKRALALQSSTVFATMQNMKDETTDVMAKLHLETEGLANAITGTMQGSVSAFINEYKNFDEKSEANITKSFDAFDKGLSEIVIHLSGTLVEIRDMMDNIPRMLKDTTEQFEAELKQCVKTVAQLSEQTRVAANNVNQELTQNVTQKEQE